MDGRAGKGEEEKRRRCKPARAGVAGEASLANLARLSARGNAPGSNNTTEARSGGSDAWWETRRVQHASDSVDRSGMVLIQLWSTGQRQFRSPPCPKGREPSTAYQ